MIRFLKDRIGSISSDSEEILKLNKSHTNRIIQIVPCNTALISAYQMWGSQEKKDTPFQKIICSTEFKKFKHNNQQQHITLVGNDKALVYNDNNDNT